MYNSDESAYLYKLPPQPYEVSRILWSNAIKWVMRKLQR